MKQMNILLLAFGLISSLPEAFAANGSFNLTGGKTTFAGDLSLDPDEWAGIWHQDRTQYIQRVLSMNSTAPFNDYFTLFSGNTIFFQMGKTSIFSLSNGKFGDSFANAEALDIAGRMRLDAIGPLSPLAVVYGTHISGNPTTVDTFMAGAEVLSNTGINQKWSIYVNNAWRFQFRGDNIAVKSTGGSWSVWTSKSQIEDVKPYGTGLATVQKVNPVVFRYNGLAGSPKDGTEYVGVVAQELEKVAPSMVESRMTELYPAGLNATAEEVREIEARGQKADLKTVDPGEFTYMLINAVKELHAQNQAIEQMVCKEAPEAEDCR